MKPIATVASHTIAVRPVDHGWELLCTPGPLSRLLWQLAGLDHQTASSGEPARWDVVPLTPALDQALTQLVDAIIWLRYETGRVQLELFSEEEL